MEIILIVKKTLNDKSIITQLIKLISLRYNKEYHADKSVEFKQFMLETFECYKSILSEEEILELYDGKKAVIYHDFITITSYLSLDALNYISSRICGRLILDIKSDEYPSLLDEDV